MIDFTKHIRDESRRFVAALHSEASLVLDRPVPTCPDWTLADLIWHLATVQDFWTYILSAGVTGPDSYDPPARPKDDQLVSFLSERGDAMVEALDRPDHESCWSWSPLGGTVGWVRRRQAHEALVHRVDAELTLDHRTAIDQDLAADGIDEIVRVMLDVGELPPWASFRREEHRIVLDTGTRWWALRLGRFVGIKPDEAKPIDLPALSVEAEGTGTAETAASAGDTRVAGTVADINLWLWGRADGSALTIAGDAAAATRLRATAQDATG